MPSDDGNADAADNGSERELHSSPSEEEVGKRNRPGRKKKVVANCQLCNVDLATDRPYYQRYRICPTCAALPSVAIDGAERPQRFCQQCGRFQDIELFQGTMRTCRERLDKHAARRRKNSFIYRSDDAYNVRHTYSSYAADPPYVGPSVAGGNRQEQDADELANAAVPAINTKERGRSSSRAQAAYPYDGRHQTNQITNNHSSQGSQWTHLNGNNKWDSGGSDQYAGVQQQHQQQPGSPMQLQAASLARPMPIRVGSGGRQQDQPHTANPWEQLFQQQQQQQQGGGQMNPTAASLLGPLLNNLLQQQQINDNYPYASNNNPGAQFPGNAAVQQQQQQPATRGFTSFSSYSNNPNWSGVQQRASPVLSSPGLAGLAAALGIASPASNPPPPQGGGALDAINLLRAANLALHGGSSAPGGSNQSVPPPSPRSMAAALAEQIQAMQRQQQQQQLLEALNLNPNDSTRLLELLYALKAGSSVNQQPAPPPPQQLSPVLLQLLSSGQVDMKTALTAMMSSSRPATAQQQEPQQPEQQGNKNDGAQTQTPVLDEPSIKIEQAVAPAQDAPAPVVNAGEEEDKGDAVNAGEQGNGVSPSTKAPGNDDTTTLQALKDVASDPPSGPDEKK